MTHGARPEWLDGFLDYPHGGLSEERARQLAWYAQVLQNGMDKGIVWGCAQGRAARAP